MLSEMIKFSSQHRALYCYLIMSVWIFLIVAGMYKYIVTEESINMPKQSSPRRDIHHLLRGDVKLKRIVSKYCNAPENIHMENEGLFMDDVWSLQGVIVVVRHGDRGPLTHIRGIEKVNCDPRRPTPLLRRYQDYITNVTGAGRAPWAQVLGPFHNFPLVPGNPTAACRLGQLTLLGVQQLLATGTLLGEAYAAKLGWNLQHNVKDSNITNRSQLKVKTTNKNNNSAPVDVSLKIKKSDDKLPPDSAVTNENIKDGPQNAKSNTKATGNIDPKIQPGIPTEGDIIVHSTRYRRALQSALALVWGMLGGVGGAGGAVAKESPSLAFCSADCACPAANTYAKMVSHELKERLDSHPAIEDLVSQLSKIVSQSPSQSSRDPHILEDALLAYVCHSAPLPCVEKPVESTKPNLKTAKEEQMNRASAQTVDAKTRSLLTSTNGNARSQNLHTNDLRSMRFFDNSKKENVRNVRDVKAPVLDFDSQMEKEKLGYYQQKLLENADTNYQDVILVKRNMDGDFNFDNQNNPETQDADDSDDYDEKDEADREHSSKSTGSVETLCIRKDQVTGLFAYTDWEMKQYAKSKNLKKASLLRAYGMIRHIVQYILRMISEEKPKFVLFSGHDKTLQYLSLALGLADDNLLHIHYASRMTIEVYRNIQNKNNDSFNDGRRPKMAAPLDFYLRVVMNGRDVTDQLTFCKGKKSIIVNNRNKASGSKTKTGKSYLCRIENIIRFTHEDYFSIFNSSNFKDACALH